MNDVVVDVRNVTIRFNLASEKIDNLKEYVIKVLNEEEKHGDLSEATDPVNLLF